MTSTVNEQEVRQFLKLNCLEIIDSMKEQVNKLLENESFFENGLELAFHDAFVFLVKRLIREQVQSAFKVNVHDAHVLTEDNIPEEFFSKKLYQYAKH